MPQLQTSPPRALQPADYEDMRAQIYELGGRASQAGLSHIAFALEVVVLLLNEAQADGKRPGAD
jgi:hypothetical protein